MTPEEMLPRGSASGDQRRGCTARDVVEVTCLLVVTAILLAWTLIMGTWLLTS